MADLRAKFIKILKAEIEDLLEDVDVAERRLAARFARRELTDYVYKQNDGLFRMEVDSLKRILDYVGCVDCAEYADLDALVSAVDISVREAVKDHQEPEAIYRFFSRKLDKVRRYVESGLEP